MFRTNLGQVVRSAIHNQDIYWQVVKEYQKKLEQRKRCCRNCRYFNDNPYLPCAVNPSAVDINAEITECLSFESKWE